MITKFNLVRVILTLMLLSAINSQLTTAFAQGVLTPPGPPAPTMKSLDQIEARTPISSAPFNITQSGSYYLTTNLIVNFGNAINIMTNGVTLDLNGFGIISTQSPAGTGVAIEFSSGLRNIAIANGFIQGSVTNNGSGVYSGNGFGSGIGYLSSPPVNVRVSGVSVSGCLYSGITLDVGDSTVVESCTVRTVGNNGIVATTIKQSSALDCGDNAIYGAQVFDCRGQSINDQGVFADTAQNCVGASDGDGDGIDAESTALNCNGYSSNGTGVSATTAQNCQGISGGSGDGLDAENALNCYGSSLGNGNGVDAQTAENCYGQSYGSGMGVDGFGNALDCEGYSESGDGIVANVANGCSGISYGSPGYGVNSYIANVCSGTSFHVTYNVNSH